jgi:Na+-driven multidrug efflux pump
LSLSFPFGGVTVMVSYALQGYGRGVSSLIVSCARQVLVLIPLAYALSKIMGLTGIWWGFLAAEVGVMVISLAVFRRIQNKDLAKI